METWEQLEKWADNLTKEYIIKLLKESNISDIELMKELGLNEEEFIYFIKKMTGE
jgi:oligoribonuclease NrnB/cAMP/cGMP phosphodiesterase (DHH superfamily)